MCSQWRAIVREGHLQAADRAMGSGPFGAAPVPWTGWGFSFLIWS